MIRFLGHLDPAHPDPSCRLVVIRRPNVPHVLFIEGCSMLKQSVPSSAARSGLRSVLESILK